MTKTSSEDSMVFHEQEKLYDFPYHHLPHFDDQGIGSTVRRLHWGFEYLCLLLYTKQTIEGLKPTTLLDVGCGDGALIRAIDGNIELTGVDLSKPATEFAKGFNLHHADICCANAADIDVQFETVTAMEVLEHIPDDIVDSFLTTLVERTKTKGYVYLTVPSTNVPLNKKHYRHYDPQLLEKHVRPKERGLRPIWVKYFYRDLGLLKLYNRLCDNRYFKGEFHPLRKLLWKRTWEAANKVDASSGQHLVALYQKL